MGIIATWNEYQEFIGSAVGTVAKIASHHIPIVQGITNAMCTLNRKYPNTFGGRGYSKYWVKSVCVAPLPIPRLPSSHAFTGGQSTGVPYKLRYWNLTALGNNDRQPLYRDPADQLFTSFETYIGKVTGFQLKFPDGRPYSYDSYKAAGKNFTQGYYLEIYSQNGTKTDTISFANSWGYEPSGFVRADGQPDTGGNPPTPPIPDDPINSDDFCFTVDGTKYCIPQNQIDNDPFCFIGGGVKICIGTDGITIEDLDKNLDKEPFDPENFDEEDSPCTPPSDVVLNEQGLPPEGVTVCESDDAKDVEWILVSVNEFKPSRKAILRTPEDLTTIFAGYLAWKVKLPEGDYYMDEIPIRKKKNAYKKPDGATGYAAYANYDAKISIKEYKQKASTKPKQT